MESKLVKISDLPIGSFFKFNSHYRTYYRIDSFSGDYAEVTAFIGTFSRCFEYLNKDLFVYPFNNEM